MQKEQNVIIQHRVFSKIKYSLYRVDFCTGLHCKNQLCENDNLSLYIILTLRDYKEIFVVVKIKNSYHQKVAHSKIQSQTDIFSFKYRIFEIISVHDFCIKQNHSLNTRYLQKNVFD